MSNHSKHSFISSPGCHHPERISCKITDSWKLQSVVSPPTENVSTLLYHQHSVALNFLLMSLSHAFGQHSVTRTKDVLSRVRSARIDSSAGRRTRPENTSTSNPCGLTSPTQDSSAQLTCISVICISWPTWKIPFSCQSHTFETLHVFLTNSFCKWYICMHVCWMYLLSGWRSSQCTVHHQIKRNE